MTAVRTVSGPAVRGRFGWRWWLRKLERMLAIVGALWLIFHLTLIPSVIVSPSMAPTLQGESWNNGDCVLTERVSYRVRRPRRWEVITFRRPDGMLVMKRVVGLPGETVQLRHNGELIINNSPAPQPPILNHLRYIPIGKVSDDRAVDCGAGYFVLGDDAKDSDDSRYEGPIPANVIVGRAWWIVGPWSRVGRVNRL